MTNPSLFVFMSLFIGGISQNVICPKFSKMRKQFVVEGIRASTAKAVSDAQSQVHYHAILWHFHIYSSFLRSLLHIVA